MSAFEKLFQDPPPEFAFEISTAGIAMSRTRPPMSVQFASLPAGALVPSPVKDNVVDHEALAQTVAKLIPPATGRARRACTLILPDNSMRLSVVDFDTLPDKEEERAGLIKFRLRKTLPFDVDEAAFSYCVQKGNKVLTAVAPVEIVSRYEAPFRAAGLHPGLVTSSSLAMIELLPPRASLMVAYRSPGALSVLVLDHGVLTLLRTLELTGHTADPLAEIADDLYPTLVYVEDQTGLRPSKLTIAGFGQDSAQAAARLGVELEVTVESVADEHPGLAGYLQSLVPVADSKAPKKKVAA